MPGHTTAAAVFFGAVVMLSVASAEEGPPDVIECKIIHEGSREDICTFVTTPANNCRTESIFPYVTAYYCWGGALLPGFLMFCYIVWNLLLFVVLATTADDYFAPSLTTLCNWLGLRERIAGLTFLALGNGAADMFSVIAAVQVGATDLAVGALQGGSMCVTTVVTVGVLCAVQGGEVKASGVFFA
jgi:sodium/potassium/calcium exchanger 6